LCPDTPSYLLDGGTRSRTFGAGLKFNVQLHANVTEGQADVIERTVVYTSMINRYFLPREYESDGFMHFIAFTENKFDLKD
jgi:hypothetical protein